MINLDKKIRRWKRKARIRRRRRDFARWYRGAVDRPVVVQVSSAVQEDGVFVNYGDHTMVTPVERFLDARGRPHTRLLREKLDVGTLPARRGGVFIDSSGFMYSSMHLDKRSINAAAATLHNVALFRQAGFKTVLAPQSLGPFGDELRPLVASLLEQFDLVYARDPVSKGYVDELGVLPEESVRVAQDTAIVYHIESKELGRSYLKRAGVPAGNAERPVVGINLNRQVSERFEGYLDATGRLVESLHARGIAAVLIPHERGRGGPGEVDDQVLTRQMSKRYGVPALLKENDSTLASEADYVESVESAIASLDFLVAGRFHVTVRGVAEHVPTMCNSWSHKYETLYERVGLDARTIFGPDEMGPGAHEAYLAKFDAAWERRGELRATLERELPSVRKEIAGFFEAAVALGEG